MKAGVIVAHPDDETMYCGGTIHKFGSWDWDVVCAAHALETPRGQELQRACRILGAKPIMLNVAYGGKHAPNPIRPGEVIERLQGEIDLHSYDLILTHNANGEYHQADHIVINQVVMGLVKCPIWMFGFNELAVDLAIFLNDADKEAKLKALACYKSQQDRVVLVDAASSERYVVKWP